MAGRINNAFTTNFPIPVSELLAAVLGKSEPDEAVRTYAQQ